jgi:hypothetical protein
MMFVEAVKTSRSDLLYLIVAPDEVTMKKAWWYVQVENKQKLPLFLERTKKQGIKLTDYGTILYSGWGTEPPEDIKHKIKEQFG